MAKTYNVAVVGATGAVGIEFLKLLTDRKFPLGKLRLLASSRSAGKTLEFEGQQIVVEETTKDSFAGVDIAFFSAGGGRSLEFAPAAAAAGAIVIDNSSAYRMDPKVPLIVPEINIEDAKVNEGIIANPNCSTIIMLMAVGPIHAKWPVKRIVVSTYQSTSGAGAAGMEELVNQTESYLKGDEIQPKVFPHQIAFNLFSHNTKINELGYNEEEWKMVKETQKILHVPDMAVTATCVRVPILRAHSESINIEFENERPSVEEIRALIAESAGVVVVDDAAANHFPMPQEASGQYDVLVGRIRHDVSNSKSVDLFVSGDQLLKGAALNGIQIAEGMIQHGWL